MTFYESCATIKKCKASFTFCEGGYYVENKIKEYRKKRKITQDDLAEAVGVTRQTIISLESGKYNASLQLAFKIAYYFDTSIEDIFIFKEV